MDGMNCLKYQDESSMKRILLVFLYFPILSSYILVIFLDELFKHTGFVGGLWKLADVYTECALICSAISLVSVVILLTISFFTKRINLFNTMWLHTSIVVVLWLFFLGVYPAVGFFYD